MYHTRDQQSTNNLIQHMLYLLEQLEADLEKHSQIIETAFN